MPTILATADPNTASTTVVVSADHITDGQAFIGTKASLSDMECSFFVRGANLPAPGKYSVSVTTKGFVASNNHAIGLKLNGLPLIDQVQYSHTTKQTVVLYNGTSVAGAEWRHRPPFITIRPNDVIEVCLFRDRWVASVPVSSPPELWDIQFTLIDSSQGGNLRYPQWAIPDDPLGYTSSQVGLSLTTVTYPSRSFGEDICVTNDGSVYVVWIESNASNYYGPVLWKWNGSTWSVISNCLSVRGTNVGFSVWRWGCSIATDGTNVYVAWFEWDGTTVASQKNMRWHCKKYDGATITQLGTGQRGIVTRTIKCAQQNITSVAEIAISPAGVPYVAWVENDDSATTIHRPYIYKWNGSSWVDTNFRDNALAPDTNAVYNVYSAGGGLFHYSRLIDLAFCHHSGPSEYPSVAFFYQNATQNKIIYAEYDGANWSSVRQDMFAVDIFNTRTSDAFGHWHQGFSFFDDGEHPYILANLGRSGSVLDYIDIAVSNGSIFVPAASYPAAQLGQWASWLCNGAGKNGHVYFAWWKCNEDSQEPYTINVGQLYDIGSGGYISAGVGNNASIGEESANETIYPMMTISPNGTKGYILASVDRFTAGGVNQRGVWECPITLATIAGVISMKRLVSI